MDNPKTYVTSDLYLTAYLKIKGYRYNVEKLKSKSTFIFNESPELISDVNDYLTENGNCEPLTYTNAIKNLKNFLHNNK
jgi:hypothetical protein